MTFCNYEPWSPIVPFIVKQNAERVKKLGEWPEWIGLDSLISRIPVGNNTAPGFDAGIACALDLIPRDKQKLSATLHANYSIKAVEQVRQEVKELESNPDSETCWWLAACYVCKEGGVDQIDFINQVGMFKQYTVGSTIRVKHALSAWEEMNKSFTVVDGIAVALRDGGMQGAYVAGYDVAVQPMYGIWFVGTFHDSLGIPDDFQWGNENDELGRPKSGPVHGSKQFVKCATFSELDRVLYYAKSKV